MENYKKNSSKLLPIIDSENNRVVLHSIYDTFINVGDNIYIIVVDETKKTPEYLLLDSINTMLKYKVIKKTGNRITVDIAYDEFISIYKQIKNTNVVELIPPCYISRIYISNSEIISGEINSVVMKENKLQPVTKTNIVWKQGVILSSNSEIINIDFNPKNDDEYLVLTSRYNINTKKIEYYFTKNNKNNGLTFINVENEEYLNLTDCNVNIGYYEKIIFNTSLYNTYNINSGVLLNCNIDGSYIVNGGNFIDCVLLSNYIIWNNGIWDNTINTIFKPQIWGNGIWKNGIFSNNTKWVDGVFENGVFYGNTWVNGVFNGGTFEESNWENGVFNGGLLEDSVWKDGIFNGGVINKSDWFNGKFNAGYMVDTEWFGGEFNNGEFYHSIWYDGVFNNGLFNESTWYNGVFNNGVLTNTTWYNGVFYNGLINGESIWVDGRFYNGRFENSNWKKGVVHYGEFNDVDWDLGDFYNGIMVNSRIKSVNWYNGISNNNILGINNSGVINWYNGSFNSGQFGFEYDLEDGVPSETDWLGGTFYSGLFYGRRWLGGIVYTCENFDNNVIDSKYFLDKVFEPYKN